MKQASDGGEMDINEEGDYWRMCLGEDFWLDDKEEELYPVENDEWEWANRNFLEDVYDADDESRKEVSYKPEEFQITWDTGELGEEEVNIHIDMGEEQDGSIGKTDIGMDSERNHEEGMDSKVKEEDLLLMKEDVRLDQESNDREKSDTWEVLETVLYNKHRLEPILEEEETSHLTCLGKLLEMEENGEIIENLGDIHSQESEIPSGSVLEEDWTLGDSLLFMMEPIEESILVMGDRVMSYFVEIKVGGRIVKALIDTGASVNVLTTAILAKCPNLNDSCIEAHKVIKGIGNVRIQVEGILETNIQMGETDYTGVEFVILDSSKLPVDAVLGLNFLRINNICLDLGSGILSSNKEKIKLIPKRHQNIPRGITVRLAEDITIPEWCQMMLLGEINARGLEGKDMIFNPLRESHEIERDWEETGLLLGKSVGKVRDGKFLIPLLNNTLTPIKLYRGEWLGEVDSIAPVKIDIDRDEIIEEGFTWAEVFMTGEIENKHLDMDTTREGEKQAHLLYDLEHIKEGRKELEDLLDRYEEVTSKGDYDIGDCLLPPLDLDTGNHPPICIPPRRMNPNQKEKIREHVKLMCQARIIKPSNSPWSFPLVPVSKRDGDVRPCADLRQINQISRFEAHPLPNINDCLMSLKGSRIFTSLDLNKGFNQMRLTEGASERCAFPFDGILYQYLRVPFGLKQSPGWFQMQMQTVLAGLQLEEVLVYLDDFLVHSADVGTHIGTLEQVLLRLQKFKLKVKPRKCEMMKSKVEYLGHTVSGEGISPMDSNVKAIRNFRTPRTCREVKRFIGMAGWYRQFIKDFGSLTKPLTSTMSKKMLVWDAACEKSFNDLKDCFLSVDVLAYPDYGSVHPLILTCDASASGSGAYLSQFQEGRERIIGYCSKAFNEAQSKMSAFDKELEGIRLGVKHFRPHIAGKKVIIRTDHRPIVDLARQKHLSARLYRIYELLGTFDITIEYVPGKCNNISDALSRSSEMDEIPIIKDPVILPEGVSEYLIIGGGDSLVRAIAHSLMGDEEMHQEIRTKIYERVKIKPSLFGLKPDLVKSNNFRRLKLEGEPLYLEHLDWVSKVFKINITVYQSGTLPINFNVNSETSINLVCKDGIHFNSTKWVVEDNIFWLEPEYVSEETLMRIGELKPIGEPSYKAELRICPSISKHHLQKWQDTDRELHMLKLAVKVGNDRVAFLNMAKREGIKPQYITSYHQLRVVQDLLVLETRPFSAWNSLLVPLIPMELVPILIQEIHVGLKHLGVNKIKDFMETYFYFPNMLNEIGKVLGNCLACKMYKEHNCKNMAPHKQIITSEPYELVCMDLAEFPKSKSGHKYVLIMVDHYSKKAMARALRNKEGRTIATELEKVFLPAFNVPPRQILSDNGLEFKNGEVKGVMNKYSIKHLFTAPYYPANNGLVERCIGTFKSMLRTSVTEKEDWEQMLPSIVIIYNNTNHRITNVRPAEVFQGKVTRMAIPDKDLDKVIGFIPYEVGDKVLKKVINPPKMGIKFEPGYIIVWINKSNKTYIVKRMKCQPGELVTFKCHHNHLRYMGKASEEEMKLLDKPDREEIGNLKNLARLSIHREIGEQTGDRGLNSTRSNSLRNPNPEDRGEMGNQLEEEIFEQGDRDKDRLRKSVRVKKPPDYYGI